MPSAMIHLLVGRYYDVAAPSAFFIGTLAPDCIEERAPKDKIHFRDCSNRLAALEDYAHSLDANDPYCVGVLLHLYTDLLWDKGPQTEHRNAWTADPTDWFLAYRQEIARATAALYRKNSWGEVLFNQMLACPPQSYSGAPNLPPEIVRAEIELKAQNHRNPRHRELSWFSNESIDAFAREAAQAFRTWIFLATTK